MVKKYLELAKEGKNQWWRYLLSVLLIFFSWFILGSLPYIFLISVARSDNNPNTFFNPQTSQFEGFDTIWIYLAINFSFILFALALYLAIRFIHQRPLRTLVTPYRKVNWRRILQGGGVYLILLIVLEVVYVLVFRGSYNLTFRSDKFFVFLLVALIVTPIQTTVEELFFRGYIMQWIGLKVKKPLLPILCSSFVFMLPHLLNPEVAKGFFLLATSYFALGLFLAIITVKDNTLELAIGIHAANNLFAALLVNYTNSALPSESIFVGELNPVFSLLSLIFIVIAFYMVFFGRRKLIH